MLCAAGTNEEMFFDSPRGAHVAARCGRLGQPSGQPSIAGLRLVCLSTAGVLILAVECLPSLAIRQPSAPVNVSQQQCNTSAIRNTSANVVQGGVRAEEERALGGPLQNRRTARGAERRSSRSAAAAAARRRRRRRRGDAAECNYGSAPPRPRRTIGAAF